MEKRNIVMILLTLQYCLERSEGEACKCYKPECTQCAQGKQDILSCIDILEKEQK